MSGKDVSGEGGCVSGEDVSGYVSEEELNSRLCL